MSESDSLRDELTKRGVEYEVDDGKTVRVTRWKAYGEWVSFIEYDTGETRFCTDMRRFTPAQAIAATLGSGTCHNVHEPPKDETFWPAPHFKCSECGATHVSMEYVFYCPNCGRKVEDE